uniref:Uncharacterized protein n=1 Tax=Amorphochlora amoebiformis TaxID=1561963 RepID=A0A7S0GPC7_9EUKA|mmetsp:Transcript_10124/g.15975  ORF Transcript_10124/g.15975 Transcript_10124/m.15975 type:complete len:215 (+) Transcript_10124:40-684(+)
MSTLRCLLWFLCVLYITDGAKSALNMCKTLAPHFTNFEDAQTCYNACSYNSPPLYASVTALIEKAFIWLRDGANFEAAVAYRQIACDYSRPPPSVLFNLYLAVLPINTREAILCLSELIDQSPGDDEALIALAELQLPYLPPQRHLEERLDRCIGIIEDRIKKAEIVVDGALARLYAYRAALAARRGYPVEATKYFRSAFSLSVCLISKLRFLC